MLVTKAKAENIGIQHFFKDQIKFDCTIVKTFVQKVY